MNIKLHIERLVLDGLPIGSEQGALVQAAVELELARLLSEGGLAEAWSTGGAVSTVRADTMQLMAPQDPFHLGAQIAHAVYGGLGQPQGVKT